MSNIFYIFFQIFIQKALHFLYKCYIIKSWKGN
uniref:Uncharacterized protein n=1 Tax=Podoviridae sp. ctack17 TaxID=2825260 RepID=A0A8S5PYV3_9CAUD|nr:MAG TPA: hypothetical protein [Podoviridae sp. ctack17]